MEILLDLVMGFLMTFAALFIAVKVIQSNYGVVLLAKAAGAYAIVAVLPIPFSGMLGFIGMYVILINDDVTSHDKVTQLVLASFVVNIGIPYFV